MCEKCNRAYNGVALVASIALGVVAVVGVIAFAVLADHERPVPGALVALVSAAAGSLAGVISLAVLARDGRRGNGG